MSSQGDRLWAYGLFGAVLSAAGLPIYIFGPKFYADSYGVGLGALGAVLFALRLIDVVQDPVLGWVSERIERFRPVAILIAVLTMAFGMLMLFAVPPLTSPVFWFGLSALMLFTAFSFLSISFYARGVAKASDTKGGHLRLAAWREGGALAGVCIAAMLPTLLGIFTSKPYAIFAFAFSAASLTAWYVMRSEWRVSLTKAPVHWGTILGDRFARKLLVLALVNGTPLAITSTLFLFYVESRLNAGGWEGPLLLLFFLAAAVSSPVWSRLAQRYGERGVLFGGMLLAIFSFGFALTLSEGDLVAFVAICVVSGAAIGADLTLLPAMFARRLSVISPNGGQGFGLWSFVNKFALAFAAVTLLPLLEARGFVAGQSAQSEEAKELLAFLYAGVPSILKVFSIGLLWRLPLQRGE